MSNFLSFNEGRSDLVNNGLPAEGFFLLSTKSVDATTPFAATDTLAAAELGEITGTGYERLAQTVPPATDGVVAFSQVSWNTGLATDWPAQVRSVVLVTSTDDSGVALAAWNLQLGGGHRNLSPADTTEQYTPTLFVG